MNWPVKGCEPLNIEVAEKNLLAIKKVFNACDITFWLVFGTALGAYRDRNFIPYDYDTDIAIFDSCIPKLSNATIMLQNNGFTLSRITGQLISYARNKEYIDVYIFSKLDGMYKCGNYKAECQEFDYLNAIKFLDDLFPIPANTERYLERRYGKDWKKPIRNRPTKF